MQPPSAGVQDEPTYCLRVNTEWVSYLSGLIKRGESEGFWDTDDEMGQEGIRHIQDLLADTECEECPQMVQQIVILEHQQAEGNAGGGIVSGSWLQDWFQWSIIRDDTGLVSTDIQGNITMPSGLWHIRHNHYVINTVSAFHAAVRMQWQDSNNSTHFKNSHNARGAINSAVYPELEFKEEMDINGFVTTHTRISSTQGTHGLGLPKSWGVNEVYGRIVMERFIEL